MCRKLVVTNKLGLGSRELGWETYSLPKGKVVEFKSRQLKDIQRFFTTNMMQKVHINSLTPIVEDDCLAKLFYIVIGTHKAKQETVYDVVTSMEKEYGHG